MNKLILCISLCFAVSQLNAQTELEMLRKGNKEFLSKDFEEAEKSYQKALEINDSYGFAMFNLGNTFFIKEDFEQAQSQYENAALNARSKPEKSNAYYNLASSYVMTALQIAKAAQENPAAAEEAGDPYSYLEKGSAALKDALRNNPADEDARYNLAFLQKLMQQQPPQQEQNEDQENQDGDGDKNEDEQQQQKPDEGEGDKDEENKNDGNEDNSEENQEEKENENEKPKPKELSKEDAKRLLEAIDKQEKDIREKMNLKKTKGERIRIEKDW